MTAPPPEESFRVLFVDDDPILGEFAKVHLANPPMIVKVAVDGSDAWEKLQAAAFDIVLLDIEMPVLDGFGLLARIRGDDRFAKIPVVMLTGREDIPAIDRAFQLGANSFVSKPINWRQVIYVLRYVMRSTRMEAELVRERQRRDELLQLTNNLLSLLKLEARTPLSAIIGFSDCIRLQIDGPVGSETYLRYAQEIDTSARQLQDNLMDLIQYAQLSSGAATLSEDEYQAAKVMDAALSDFAATRPSVSLETLKPDEEIYILCDLHWLSRALRHLLDCAANEGGVEGVAFTTRQSTNGDLVISIVSRRIGPAKDATADHSGVRAASIETVRQQLGVSVPFARRIAELHDGVLRLETGDLRSSIEIVIPAHRVLTPRNAKATAA